MDNQPQSDQLTPTGDAKALRHLEQAIASGKHWYIALIEAIGLWASTEEDHNGRHYLYLIEGEAFDWPLLAEPDILAAPHRTRLMTSLPDAGCLAFC